jgi:hypothetical protein
MVLTMPQDDSWNVVYAYTRSQAIADGVLVDVTKAAKAIGFKLHTVGRGRDHPFGWPPAQIPASGIPALGSYLGCLA